MQIKGIDFPEPLIRAQANGDLVVFAGAGVSAPPPASLPLFSGLAEEIGSPSGLKRNDDEPYERYLGRLKNQNVHVHEIAARRLVNNNTKPHALHNFLLRLFPSASALRIVTTNFDTHFTSASRLAFAQNVDIYFAPALPLGDDFNGLVYLHGCAGQAPSRCVLTDEDFGRAYLTQAWASRFLLAMFSRYVILFVGYSHNDTVMSYLARGLPPVKDKRRFVLGTGNARELEKWEFFGIQPLVYTLSAEENPHRAISVSVGEWVAELNRGMLEKTERIRSITEAQPPLEGEDSDYIEFSLRNSAIRPLIFKFAKRPGWISWFEKHEFLSPLFALESCVDEIHMELAFWLTDNFMTDFRHEFFALIQRKAGKMSRNLCWAVRRRLGMRESDLAISTVFSEWVGVLLSQPSDRLNYSEWAQLLAQCQFPQDKTVSVFLFDRITRPRIVLKERWIDYEGADKLIKVDFDLAFEHELDHWASKAWENLIRPNFAEYAISLEPIVFNNLRAAYEWQTPYSRTKTDQDPFYVHRQSVRCVNENGFRSAIDLLFDCARDILLHLLQWKHSQALVLIERCLESGIPCFKRLAIFGTGKRRDLSADQKLDWILKNEFIYWTKTDVFEFVHETFAVASDDSKKALIARVLKGPMIDGVQDGDRTKDYEIFNWLVWLKRAAPTCPIVQEALASVRSKHPDFGERTNPELDYWSSGVESVDALGSMRLEDFEGKSPKEILDELLAWRPVTPFGRTRSSYCNIVSGLVAKKPEWGFLWLNTLTDRKLADTDLWQCVCQGWRNGTFTADQWKSLLRFVIAIDGPPEFFSGFVDVLEHGSRREQHALPIDEMDEAQVVAQKIWSMSLEKTLPEEPLHADWLSTAINRPGGRLAEFWLQRISAARKTAGDTWSGFPASLAQGLSEMLASTSGAAEMARVVFASQLHYFCSLDSAFALEHVLPLFDWQKDERKARQAWHGYLCWGRWLPGFTESLLPHFYETVLRYETFQGDVRKALLNHVAGVALFRIQNPLAERWLFSVVQMLGTEDREDLARNFDYLLKDMDSANADALWDRWFGQYFQSRLDNLPVQLTAKEAAKMIFWCLAFRKNFSESVKKVLSLEGRVLFEDRDLFNRLKGSSLLQEHPDSVAELILFFLRAKPPYIHFSDSAKSVWKTLKSSKISAEKVNQLRESMLSVGLNPEE